MSEPQSPQPRTRNSTSPAPIVGRGHSSATSLPSPRYTDAITDSPRPSDGLRLARPRRSQTRLGRRTACGSHDHADHRLASAVGRPAARTTTPITDSPRPSDGLRLVRPRRSQTRLGRRTAGGSYDHADHRLASAVGRPAARTTTPITDSPRPSDGLRLVRPRRSRGERPGGAPEPGGNPAAERDREL